MKPEKDWPAEGWCGKHGLVYLAAQGCSMCKKKPAISDPDLRVIILEVNRAQAFARNPDKVRLLASAEFWGRLNSELDRRTTWVSAEPRPALRLNGAEIQLTPSLRTDWAVVEVWGEGNAGPA